jgi:hypothetical protein
LERLVEADILFVEGVGPQATYRFKHALIQDAAYDSLLKSRRQALHRRAAELLRDDAERAAAEPEVMAHHFTKAGRPVEAHAILAPALEGFSPTPEMPQIAEAQALVAALAETDEARRLADFGESFYRLGRAKTARCNQSIAVGDLKVLTALASPGLSGWPPTTASGPAATYAATCRR